MFRDWVYRTESFVLDFFDNPLKRTQYIALYLLGSWIEQFLLDLVGHPYQKDPV